MYRLSSHEFAFPVKREDRFFRSRGGGVRQVWWDGAGRGGHLTPHGEQPRRAEGAGGRSQRGDGRSAPHRARFNLPEAPPARPRRRDRRGAVAAPLRAAPTAASRGRRAAPPGYVRTGSARGGAARAGPARAGPAGEQRSARRRGPHAGSCAARREQCRPAEAEVTELG